MEREIAITVTEEEARRIDERVASGEYTSAADYVHTAVADFATFEWDGPPLSDEMVRQLIEEDEADAGPDLDADEVFERLHRYIDELIAKRNARVSYASRRPLTAT